MLKSLLKGRGIFCNCHGESLLICALAILHFFVVFARDVNISPLPVSDYADTEVTTNIVFNATRIDVKRFEFQNTHEKGLLFERVFCKCRIASSFLKFFERCSELALSPNMEHDASYSQRCRCAFRMDNLWY